MEYTDEEKLRMAEVARINSEAAERKVLEERYGQVWNTEELSRDYRVMGFAAPYVVVERIADGTRGSLEFQHRPRYYFNWQAE